MVISPDNTALGVIEKFYNNGAQPIAVLNTGFEFPLVKELIEKISLDDNQKLLGSRYHDSS